jgi:hypothetical protein
MVLNLTEIDNNLILRELPPLVDSTLALKTNHKSQPSLPLQKDASASKIIVE